MQSREFQYLVIPITAHIYIEFENDIYAPEVDDSLFVD
jgi:hypothetical protein